MSAQPKNATPAAAAESATATKDNSSQAIASLVLGICGIFVALVLWAFVGVVLGVIGIVMARMGKDSSKASLAKAGLITSIVAVSLGGLFILTYILSLFALVSILT